MSNLFKTASRILLLTLLSLASLGHFPSHNRTAAGRVNPVQDQVEQDISGSYSGLVLVFRDKVESQCLMAGMAKLEIKGKQFTLSKAQSKTLKGEITTVIRTDNANKVGQLTLENDEAIEIRWYRGASRNSLKIVSAKGAKRYFRFCQANLTQTQCFD